MPEVVSELGEIKAQSDLLDTRRDLALKKIKGKSELAVARIAARVAIALCIVVAIFPSFREAFGKSVLYVSTKSGDEKTVGLLLAETEGETPALLYEFPHDQTIQYYARRRVSHLHEETASALSPPFHLIIPSQLVKDNPWLAGATQNFAGKELSLFHVAQ